MWSETKPIGERTTSRTPSCARASRWSFTSGSSHGWLGGPDREQYARSHATSWPRRAETSAAMTRARSRCCSEYVANETRDAASIVSGMECVTNTSRAAAPSPPLSASAA